VNRKVKSLARRSAFNARAEEERVVLIDPLTPAKPRTAELRNYLASIELADSKVLILTDGVKPNVHLSARNLPNVQVRKFGDEAVYDILWSDVVVIERSALDRVAEAGEEGEEGEDA
jgi:large subunit ribosomal protein L4